MILNYQHQMQLLDDWCWAAVASSVAATYNPNTPWTQGAIAGNLLSPVCSTVNAANASSAPAVCHQGFDLVSALQRTQNYAWAVNRQLTLEEICNQINNGWPVCCQITWGAYNMSHVITLYGYTGSTIILSDPEAGKFSVAYSELVTNYRTGVWDKSIGTQPAS